MPWHQERSGSVSKLAQRLLSYVGGIEKQSLSTPDFVYPCILKAQTAGELLEA
jgi:hypothetical protein